MYCFVWASVLPEMLVGCDEERLPLSKEQQMETRGEQWIRRGPLEQWSLSTLMTT